MQTFRVTLSVIIISSFLGAGVSGSPKNTDDSFFAKDSREWTYDSGNEFFGRDLSIWPDFVSRFAVKKGYDGVYIKDMYADLITKRYDELIMYSGEESPCDLYGNCGGEISDAFFQRLVSLAMKYQEIEHQKQQAQRANNISLGAALIGLLGVGLGVYNILSDIRRRKAAAK